MSSEAIEYDGDDWRSWSDSDKHRLLWKLTARPNQLTPPGKWNIWVLCAGRGFGKTRSGAEDISDFMQRNPNSRVAVVAPTIADTRDTCFEGESGLLACLPPSMITKWNRSMSELILSNGSLARGYSSEEPERLRGPQFHRAWAEELAAWKYATETWDQLMFGLRLKVPGGRPQCVVTTTPKPIKLLKELVRRSDVHVTRGSTYENAANLSPAALAQLKARYEGTRLGRQELHAELLEDVEGALWTQDMIGVDRLRVPESLDMHRLVAELNLVTIVVGVDPAVSAKKTSDETGIVVAGRSRSGHGFILADMSGRYTPDQWGRKALYAYDLFDADRIVPEVNNGGDLVVSNLRNLREYVRILPVHATRGKIVRAEPIAALYEQHKIHHVGNLPDLEEQLTSFQPELASTTTGTHDDRVDALVWALTDLFVTTREIKHTSGAGRMRLRGRR